MDIWQDLTSSTWKFFVPARERYLLADDRSQSYSDNSTSRAFAPSVVVNWYSIPKVPEIETLYLLLEFPSSLSSLSKHNYHLKAEETVAPWDQVHPFTGAPRFISVKVLPNYFPFCAVQWYNYSCRDASIGLKSLTWMNSRLKQDCENKHRGKRTNQALR